MASRQLSAKKPKDLGHTLRTLLSYLGRHKLLFLAVAVLVALSALANLLGTYMIRPVVNSLAAGSPPASTPWCWAWRSLPPSTAQGCSLRWAIPKSW